MLPRNAVEWNLLATQAATGAGGGAAAGLSSSILPGGVSADPGAPSAWAWWMRPWWAVSTACA